MKRLFAGIVTTLLVVGGVAACGDGPDARPTPPGSPPTAASTAQGAATPSGTAAAWPGPAPRLGGNITKVTPTHGQVITQFDSRSPDPGKPRGFCIEADFKDLPTDGSATLWYRIAFDGKEVTGTSGSVWLLASRDAESTSGGRLCYAPTEGFPVGRHDAAVSVQNPNNPNEPPRQVVAWKFEVK